MISLQNWNNFVPDDSELAELLSIRKQQIQYTDDIKLIIFKQSDSLESLNQTLDFDILTNHWTGERFDEPRFYPSWEYLEIHPNWLEVAYLYNDNNGVLLFIEQPLSEPLKTLFRFNLTTSENS
ncbi:hypothetical protein JCM30760_11110 [Thiomicrorhabdus hydrogeniphila]